MAPANKLPLLKRGLRMLVERLRPQDTVAIVVYADSSRVVLPPELRPRDGILQALDRLQASGSTNGGAGIQTAYSEARGHFNPEGVNRVILCTDGDFNFGIVNPAELQRFVQSQAACSSSPGKVSAPTLAAIGRSFWIWSGGRRA